MTPPKAATSGSLATILIVDDTPENLTVLGELLQPQYLIKVANSGPRALQVAAKPPYPDLILLDVMMPEMDGYAVLEALRQQDHTRDTPVIFVTAMDATEDEEKGLELGAVDYITKPIRPSIVLARVQTQLELKRARDWLKNQNAYLENEIRRRMMENQLIQDVSIRALASLAETRDTETGNHIRRTQAYVEALALKLADHPRFRHFLTPRQIDMVVKAAPLHDIGKVGIPDAILLKPSRLSEVEFEQMKSHSMIGGDAIEEAMRGALDDEAYAALKDHCELGCEALDQASAAGPESPLEFMNIAKQIAHSHHEKWDGTGYPDGLQGEDIPIPARLMALADVFDALTSKRIYKASMAVDEATALIVQGKGHHFDPDVVEAFLAIHDDFQKIALRFADEPLHAH